MRPSHHYDDHHCAYHHHHYDDDHHCAYHHHYDDDDEKGAWDLDRCGGADDAWNAPSIDGSLVWFARSSVVVLVDVLVAVLVAVIVVDVRVAVGMVASTAVALRPRTRTSGGMAGSLGPSWTIFLSFRQCGLFWNPSSWLVPHGRSSVFPFPNQCNKDDPSTMMDRTVVALRCVAPHSSAQRSLSRYPFSLFWHAGPAAALDVTSRCTNESRRRRRPRRESLLPFRRRV